MEAPLVFFRIRYTLPLLATLWLLVASPVVGAGSAPLALVRETVVTGTTPRAIWPSEVDGCGSGVVRPIRGARNYRLGRTTSWYEAATWKTLDASNGTGAGPENVVTARTCVLPRMRPGST